MDKRGGRAEEEAIVLEEANGPRRKLLSSLWREVQQAFADSTEHQKQENFLISARKKAWDETEKQRGNSQQRNPLTAKIYNSWDDPTQTR